MLYGRKCGEILAEFSRAECFARFFWQGENDDDDGDLDLLEEPSGLECEFKLSAFSQQDRRTGQGDDPRSDEYSEYMEMCYKVVMFPHKNENSVVRVTCQVLQADGSHLAAALTAGTLALIDAGIQIKDLIVGCTTTIIDGKALVDISSHEELRKRLVRSIDWLLVFSLGVLIDWLMDWLILWIKVTQVKDENAYQNEKTIKTSASFHEKIKITDGLPQKYSKQNSVSSFNRHANSITVSRLIDWASDWLIDWWAEGLLRNFGEFAWDNFIDFSLQVTEFRWFFICRKVATSHRRSHCTERGNHCPRHEKSLSQGLTRSDFGCVPGGLSEDVRASGGNRPATRQGRRSKFYDLILFFAGMWPNKTGLVGSFHVHFRIFFFLKTFSWTLRRFGTTKPFWCYKLVGSLRLFCPRGRFARMYVKIEHLGMKQRWKKDANGFVLLLTKSLKFNITWKFKDLFIVWISYWHVFLTFFIKKYFPIVVNMKVINMQFSSNFQPVSFASRYFLLFFVLCFFINFVFILIVYSVPGIVHHLLQLSTVCGLWRLETGESRRSAVTRPRRFLFPSSLALCVRPAHLLWPVSLTSHRICFHLSLQRGSG